MIATDVTSQLKESNYGRVGSVCYEPKLENILLKGMGFIFNKLDYLFLGLVIEFEASVTFPSLRGLGRNLDDCVCRLIINYYWIRSLPNDQQVG